MKAEYANMIFRGNKNESYFYFETGGGEFKFTIAPIYLKLADGEVIELATLKEERAAEWAVASGHVNRDGKPDTVPMSEKPGGDRIIVTRYQIAEDCYLDFHEGKLVCCLMRDGISSKPLAGVQYGASTNGEFLSLRCTRKDLIRVFGKPKKISRFPDTRPAI